MIVNVTLGANGTAQRFGYNTITLGILVFDTDKQERVNSTARISWTKDGFTPYDDFADCSVTNGNCTIDLDPDHAFSVGEQSFMGSVLDNNSFYKTVNSSQELFIVNGTLFTSVNGPSGVQNFNETVLFNTTVTDDTSSVREVDEVFLEYKFTNAAHWRSCTPVNASANGEYTCLLNISSLLLGAYDIRFTARKENYTSFNTTVRHQFIIVKVMKHVEKNNFTSFSRRTIRPENFNTTIDIIPLANLSNMDINITFNTTNPVPVNLSVLGLEKYLTVNVSEELGNNLSYAILKINYTEEELNMSGAVEDSLRIYRFNGTNWTAFDPPNGGVNKTEKYVWANLTTFSDFAVGGKKSNGTACSSGDECNSGNCASDFDGSGMWCAPSGNCAANYAINYENGAKLCDGSALQTCSSGSWASTACSAGCSNGACATASSGGGGGGSGGGSLAVVKKGQTITASKLAAYVPVSFRFAGLSANITNVVITPTGSFVSASVSVHEIPAPETAVDGLVYRYADIASTIPNANISSAIINFRVPRSWTAEHEIEPRSIALYRLSAGWNRLQTSMISEDQESYQYESVTPGFSVFAITGSKAVKTAEQTRTGICGNGIVEAGEACDGTVQLTCKDLGFAGGTLRCSGCRYDTSGCMAVEISEQGIESYDYDYLFKVLAAFAVSAAALAYVAHKRRKGKAPKRKPPGKKRARKKPKQKRRKRGFPFE
ncbi:PGF-pre-PGF domain-containing protein [Candidatus Woesearchaeota archaeon]|nr:PGF-pre-PGF domain-containing protein [Candidatus Woesearchaeota archaeon]